MSVISIVDKVGLHDISLGLISSPDLSFNPHTLIKEELTILSQSLFQPRTHLHLGLHMYLHLISDSDQYLASAIPKMVTSKSCSVLKSIPIRHKREALIGLVSD
jgi:hypothetical protein